MAAHKLPNNNREIAENIRSTLAASNENLRSALTGLLTPPSATKPQPERGSNLGPINIGMHRERLGNPISEAALRAKADVAS
jgi:hypothetical protein